MNNPSLPRPSTLSRPAVLTINALFRYAAAFLVCSLFFVLVPSKAVAQAPPPPVAFWLEIEIDGVEQVSLLLCEDEECQQTTKEYATTLCTIFTCKGDIASPTEEVDFGCAKKLCLLQHRWPDPSLVFKFNIIASGRSYTSDVLELRTWSTYSNVAVIEDGKLALRASDSRLARPTIWTMWGLSINRLLLRWLAMPVIVELIFLFGFLRLLAQWKGLKNVFDIKFWVMILVINLILHIFYALCFGMLHPLIPQEGRIVGLGFAPFALIYLWLVVWFYRPQIRFSIEAKVLTATAITMLFLFYGYILVIFTSLFMYMNGQPLYFSGIPITASAGLAFFCAVILEAYCYIVLQVLRRKAALLVSLVANMGSFGIYWAMSLM